MTRRPILLLLTAAWLHANIIGERSFANLKSAEERFRKYPDNANYHLAAGMGYRLKDRTKAIDHFRTAIKLRPDDREAKLWLGMTLMEGGQTEKGISLYCELAQDTRDPWGKMAERRLEKR